MERRPALFLDRDGTLIADVPYLADPAQVRLLPHAGALVRQANGVGWPVVIVTNQSGIARGLISASAYEAVADQVVAALAADDAQVTATYYCPHEPSITGPCDCRKPAIGMYRQAAHDLSLDLAASIYVGDRWRDVAAAAETGGLGLMVPGVETAIDDHAHLEAAVKAGATLRVVGSLQDIAAYLPPIESPRQ